jgi:hypothetical protein
MFTTHKTKQEFYDWWKQQDHKSHTCEDMAVFTLMKAYWSEVDVWGPLAGEGVESFMTAQLQRAFRKHNKDGYRVPINALEHLKYCLKWSRVRYGFNTFKDVIRIFNVNDSQLDLQLLAQATSRLENVIDQMEHCQETTNVT